MPFVLLEDPEGQWRTNDVRSGWLIPNRFYLGWTKTNATRLVLLHIDKLPVVTGWSCSALKLMWRDDWKNKRKSPSECASMILGVGYCSKLLLCMNARGRLRRKVDRRSCVAYFKSGSWDKALFDTLNLSDTCIMFNWASNEIYTCTTHISPDGRGNRR